MNLQEFSPKYCSMCGTQRCGGVYDEDFREGCSHYQCEILKPTLYKEKKPRPNPTQQAYDILYKIYSNKLSGWDEAEEAIDKALDYLSKALSDWEV